MSEFIRLQANGVDAYPDASTENTYRSNGTSVESALLALESNVNTLGGVAGEAKTLAEQNSVKIATAEQEISDINSSLRNIVKSFDYSGTTNSNGAIVIDNIPSDFYCFITATHNYSAYYGIIPSVINGTFKSLIFKGSDNVPMSNVSVSGKIYYVSK